LGKNPYHNLERIQTHPNPEWKLPSHRLGKEASHNASFRELVVTVGLEMAKVQATAQVNFSRLDKKAVIPARIHQDH